MTEQEIALISIEQTKTSDIKQYAELTINFSGDGYFQAIAPNEYFDEKLSFFMGYNVTGGKALPVLLQYKPESSIYNHNAFILATEINGVKVGGNYLDEGKYYATEKHDGKKIAAFVSTTKVEGYGDGYYGLIVNLQEEQYQPTDIIRFWFADTNVKIDNEPISSREVFLNAKPSYTIVTTREYLPVALLSVSLYREFTITNETAGDFTIEDQIATTDSALEFGLYAAEAKVSCRINPTLVDNLFDRDATLSLRKDDYNKSILKQYKFTTSEIEETSDWQYTISMKNRITEMQDEYLASIGPVETMTIKKLLDYVLGDGNYDIVDDGSGSLANHINNTVVKQVLSEAKTKYDFLLELCQIGCFNISFDTRFKIWRVF